MQVIGAILVAGAIIAIFWGILQKLKAGRVVDAPLAPTGHIARGGTSVTGPGGKISAQGGVVCQQPLISPVSGTPCLYYHIKCTAEWKDGDSHKSKILDEQHVAAAFALDDGSGTVWIDAREGGDFEPTQKKHEKKGTGLLGGITGTTLQFGNYNVQTGMLAMGTTYSVEEEVLPVVPRLYACGKLSEQGAIARPGFRQLILTSKSRDELLASASKMSKIFLLAGAGTFVVGMGIGLLGVFLDGKAEAEPVAAVATAAPETTTTPTAAGTATAVATATAAVTATATATETAPPVGTTQTTGASTKPTTKASGGKADAGAAKADATADAGATKSTKPAPSASGKK